RSYKRTTRTYSAFGGCRRDASTAQAPRQLAQTARLAACRVRRVTAAALVRRHQPARGRDESARRIGGKGGREILDPSARGADAWEQKGRARHGRAQGPEALGSGGAHHRPDVGQPRWPDRRAAELVDHLGQPLADRAAAPELAFLDI